MPLGESAATIESRPGNAIDGGQRGSRWLIEEQKEQLDDEVLLIDLEIEATKQKAVSAQSLTESLTTFGELYREALPEERRELIRLRVNQLVWKPDEIRLALLDSPEAYQRLGESQQMVARTGFEPVLPP